MTTPFDLIKQITKKSRTDKTEYLDYYVPWIINLAFSMDRRTIFMADAMNCSTIPNHWQYDFYFENVPKNIYCKWIKRDRNQEDIMEAVMAHFNISLQKARKLLRYLTEEEVNNIYNNYNKGIVKNE